MCQAAAGSGSSRRSTKISCSQSLAIAVSSSTPGWTRRAHSGEGHGTTVQFVVLALITSKFSASAGSASRPARAGSMPASSPGGTCGVIEMRTPCPSPRSRSRRPYQDGHEAERVLGGALEADPLDVRVEIPGVDEAGAALVRRGGDQPGERRRTRLGDDPHRLAGLDVGADLDDQVRVAVKERVVQGCVSLSVRSRSSTVRPAPPL